MEKEKKIKKKVGGFKKIVGKIKGLTSNPIHIWRFLAGIFFILALIFLFSPRVKFGGDLPSEQVVNDVMSFINREVLQGQIEATLVKNSVKKVEGEENLFQFDIELQGEKFTPIATLDGKYLFPSVFDVEKIKKERNESNSSEENQIQKEIPKTEKPDVMLFVMSFCPFGTQAEDIMKTVYDLLKDKVNFKVRFIATVKGEDLKSINSLHGIEEAKEDLRQICIANKYGNDTLWNYLSEFNKNCAQSTEDSNALDKCWKEVVNKLDIKIDIIEKCAYSREGINLLKEDEKLVNEYQIAGSPTLIINGQEYQGERNPEAYKEAICSGFQVKPQECQTKLSEEGGSAGGGCQ